MVHAKLLLKTSIPEEKDQPMREQSDIYITIQNSSNRNATKLKTK
jgi:hypothetical protein